MNYDGADGLEFGETVIVDPAVLKGKPLSDSCHLHVYHGHLC